MRIPFVSDFFERGIVRHVSLDGNALFLTFDDGPDVSATPKVLASLRAANAKATFFLVAERARANRELVAQIQAEGHSIGNHSLDHGYSAFVRGRRAILDWVRKSEDIFESLGIETVGFRPPVGIVTPELKWALRELEIPLILWNRRFFDTRFDWTEQKALTSLTSAKPGDIILLHDKKSVSWLRDTPLVFDRYLSAARAAGFEFRALTKTTIATQI